MGLGGTSWLWGCCPCCVVPLPMEINLGGLGVLLVPPGLSGAAGGLGGDKTEHLCHVHVSLDVVAGCAVTEEPGPAGVSEPALSRLTLLVPCCLLFVVLGKKQWEKGLIGDKSKQ